MKLVGSPTSPYVRKVRICLLERELPFEWHESLPWKPDSDVARFNPLGKVPALVAGDGPVWTDSPVIVEYLETLPAARRLVPEQPTEAVRVRQLEALADGICDAGVAIFLERGRDEATRSEAWIERQARKLDAGVDALSASLAEREYLYGDDLSLADIAVVCVLDWLDFRLPDYGLRGRHANLWRLAERLNRRPSFVETCPQA